MSNQKIELASNLTKKSFYIALISFILGIFFPIFLLVTIPAILVFIISFSIDAIKCHTNTDKAEDLTNFKSYFLGLDELRKKDGNVQRGDCEIEFKETEFLIKQNDEIIANGISSIYCYEIWEYKEDTYFKFRMRSGTEYKFCSQYFEADKILNIMQKYNISIEDDRI